MTVHCTRNGPIEEVPWTEEEQIVAVNKVHCALNQVTMNNCHSAVIGTGGTVRPKCLVAIFRALMVACGLGGTLLDVGCGFGHIILAALMTGFGGACGCELPANEVQRGVCYKAKERLGITPEDLCEWISCDATDLILPAHLCNRITAVYSFWFGIGAAAQRKTLVLCRETLINVRSVAVYMTQYISAPEHGMTSIQFLL